MERYRYKVITSNEADPQSFCYRDISRRQPLMLGGMFELGKHLNPRFVRIDTVYHEGNVGEPLDEWDVVILHPVPEAVFNHLTAGHYAWIPFKGSPY